MPALLLFVLAATAVSPPAGSTSGGLPPRIRAVAKATPASFGGLVARRPVLARVPRPLQARHAQLYLLFGSRMVQSSMRLAMGPLIVYICEEMGGGAGSRGKLLSAYSLGYLTSQVGPRKRTRFVLSYRPPCDPSFPTCRRLPVALSPTA